MPAVPSGDASVKAREARERLAGSALLGGLEAATLTALVESGRMLRLGDGEDLFRAGDPYRDCVFIHLQGELEQISGRGETRHAQPGDLIGLANYLDGVEYRSTARAHGPCDLLEIPDEVVRRLESESPAFFEALNRALAARMRKARQARESVRGTLARPVRHCMHSPLVSCDRDSTLSEAFELLMRRQIGSLGVTGEDGELIGILTPTTLSEALIRGGASPQDTVGESACETPYTVSVDTPLWQVEELQQRNHIRYVVVVDDDGRPLGLVSQTDLVRTLATPRQTLDAEIDAAPDLETLAELFQRLPEAAGRARETHRSTAQAVRALTDVHLAIQHRAIELVLADLAAQGHGEPPTRFALIIMGSGGRGEMLLPTDQDNGLIIEDTAGDAELRWFERFAEALNPALDQVGYPLCPGDIMARNPEFRRTLSGWRGRVTQLVEHPAEDSARWSTVVFDFVTQYGDDSLTSELRSHLVDRIGAAAGRGLLKMMVRDDAAGRPALGLFNRLVTETRDGVETIDLKRNGLRIIVDAARVFALQHRIRRTSTIERLARLSRLGVFDPELAEASRIAFEELQDLLLGHQLEQVRRGEKPGKDVRVDRLSDNDRERLRVAMRAAKRLQNHLQEEFGVDI